MIKITIAENQGNQRLDRFLKKYFDKAPLSLVYKLIRKDVKVNGKRMSEECILNVGDELVIYMDETKALELQKPIKRVKAKKQFTVVYEDENVLIAEKPFGLLTHGDKAEKKNHLANQVIDYLIENGEYNPRAERTFSPAPVNRLDRNTTGLVAFGKNAEALRELNLMIRSRDMISKYYLTIVGGKLEKKIDLRDKMSKDEKRNIVSVHSADEEDGKLMETVARPLKSAIYKGRPYTLVEVEIITGRTHQIRAQLAKAGYPVLGDTKYGDWRVNREASALGLNTHLLHAFRLVIEKTRDDGILRYLQGKEFKASLPDNFDRIKTTIFGKN